MSSLSARLRFQCGTYVYVPRIPRIAQHKARILSLPRNPRIVQSNAQSWDQRWRTIYLCDAQSWNPRYEPSNTNSVSYI